ncbi:hypothetical protein [uncultured Cedecea sp.]|uniref:hypothetical protein n=1 Tax=uncultured Cedecea sp. TaxID=988762 RepID=UPI002602B8A3|nr:hypothetical protein [uncultured Cedecea sp.]
MIRMINDKKIFLLVGFVVIALLIFLFSASKKQMEGDVYFHCATSFQMKYNKPEFIAKLNIFLQLQRDGRGIFDISGKVYSQGETFDVARTYHFIHQREGGTVYHLTDIKTSRRNYESVDETLMNSLFFSATQKEGRYLRMTKMENSYIIDNLHSPVFVCIVS